MNERLAIAAGLCFIGAFLIGMWPRSILDRVRRFRAGNGADPDERFGISEIKEAGASTYRSYLAGTVISSALGLAFFVLMLMAVF